MRTAVVFAALIGIVACQDIDFAYVQAATPAASGPPIAAVSQPATYDSSAAADAAAQAAASNPSASDKKRRRLKRSPVPQDSGACAAQPDGYGPATTDPDTPDAFLSNSVYSDAANNAEVPQGYVESFSNLQGSLSMSTYEGLYTLEEYDPIQCQQLCDAADSCYGINLYFERDPSVDPGDGCDNPPSITNIKCTLWGSQVDGDAATNTGQYRDNFQVVIAGSNGYSKNAPPPSYPDFDGPTELGGAINAPSGYIGVNYYPGPYDPSQCAAACQATTQYDYDHPRSDGSYDACNFFNSYVLSINDVPQGTYCSKYTEVWGKSYSTNYGQYDSQGNYYSVSQSYGYSLDPQDPGQIPE